MDTGQVSSQVDVGDICGCASQADLLAVWVNCILGRVVFLPRLGSLLQVLC